MWFTNVNALISRNFCEKKRLEWIFANSTLWYPYYVRKGIFRLLRQSNQMSKTKTRYVFVCIWYIKKYVNSQSENYEIFLSICFDINTFWIRGWHPKKRLFCDLTNLELEKFLNFHTASFKIAIFQNSDACVEKKDPDLLSLHITDGMNLLTNY